VGSPLSLPYYRILLAVIKKKGGKERPVDLDKEGGGCKCGREEALGYGRINDSRQWLKKSSALMPEGRDVHVRVNRGNAAGRGKGFLDFWTELLQETMAIANPQEEGRRGGPMIIRKESASPTCECHSHHSFKLKKEKTSSGGEGYGRADTWGRTIQSGERLDTFGFFYYEKEAPVPGKRKGASPPREKNRLLRGTSFRLGNHNASSGEKNRSDLPRRGPISLSPKGDGFCDEKEDRLALK